MREQQPTTLHLICGLPGVGKTTLAKELEMEQDAVRFCPDEWITSIWPPDRALNEGNLLRDNVEQLQWRMAQRCLRLGLDVVIEWGTWGLSERERLRDDARACGARVFFYYIEGDREVMRERILKRNLEGSPHEFTVDEVAIDFFLDDCFKKFQPPTEEEMETYDEVVRYSLRSHTR